MPTSMFALAIFAALCIGFVFGYIIGNSEE
jgi:hypothetical protein